MEIETFIAHFLDTGLEPAVPVYFDPGPVDQDLRLDPVLIQDLRHADLEELPLHLHPPVHVPAFREIVADDGPGFTVPLYYKALGIQFLHIDQVIEGSFRPLFRQPEIQFLRADRISVSLDEHDIVGKLPEGLGHLGEHRSCPGKQSG